MAEHEKASDRKGGTKRARGVPRLDWRFLLADPELQRVGYVGSQDGLLGHLRLLCHPLDELDVESGETQSTGKYDLVVTSEPSDRELHMAAERVTPDGVLVVEVHRPVWNLGAMARGGLRWWRVLRSPGGFASRLSELGFDHVTSYWHWPNFDGCTHIIPLDDLTAIRHAFSRAGLGVGAQAGVWLGRGLVKIGLLEWIVASMSVLGRRVAGSQQGKSSSGDPERAGRRDGPGQAVESQNLVHSFLNQQWDQLGLDRQLDSRRLSFVVLTPRFRNSSHLIFLLIPEGELEPTLVAKVPRLRGRCATTEREAEVLRQIHARRPSGFDSIPRLVAIETFGDHMILLETAMRGRSMDRATVKRNASKCCEATLSWLIEIQSATRLPCDLGGSEIERLIERDLLDVQAKLPAERSLVERARELLAPLQRAVVPLVLEHGDLSHPNLLLDPEGKVSVIDWELAELHGLPATDLFFFLSYVARALRGARSSGEALVAVDDMFFVRRSWVRTYVRRYAHGLGLSSDTLTPLFVACWARQVAALTRRASNGGENSPMSSHEISDLVRGDWRFALWRHAVDHANRLDW